MRGRLEKQLRRRAKELGYEVKPIAPPPTGEVAEPADVAEPATETA